MAAM
ncbi:hypothetical protein D031_1456A, partial [Vibrio parahaemolyticus VP-48]|jgi:hypothetical protein